MAKVNATIIEGGATFTASVTSVTVLSNIIGWDPIDAFETSPADFILSMKNIVLEGWATLTTDMRITAWRDQDPAVAAVDAAPQPQLPPAAGQEPFIGPMQPMQD